MNEIVANCNNVYRLIEWRIVKFSCLNFVNWKICVLLTIKQQMKSSVVWIVTTNTDAKPLCSMAAFFVVASACRNLIDIINCVSLNAVSKLYTTAVLQTQLGVALAVISTDNLYRSNRNLLLRWNKPCSAPI